MIINVLIGSSRFIWIPMLCVYGHYYFFYAVIDFRPQSLRMYRQTEYLVKTPSPVPAISVNCTKHITRVNDSNILQHCSSKAQVHWTLNCHYAVIVLCCVIWEMNICFVRKKMIISLSSNIIWLKVLATCRLHSTINKVRLIIGWSAKTDLSRNLHLLQVANFFWAVWALIQARYSLIDFDYLE